MKNYLRFITIQFISILVCYSFIHAGSNENVYLSLDNDFRTNQIEPVLLNLNENDTCFIGVQIDRAIDLNSYSVKLQFDSSIVSFCSAVNTKSISEHPFLELSGTKSISLTNQNKNEVEFASTSQGRGFSVSGNGFLAYFIFKCQKKGNPAIVIKEVKLIDPNGIVDISPKN